MTWDGVITKYHRRHLKDIGITESYIKIILFKKTLENISFEYRRGAERLDETEDKPVQSRSTWTYFKLARYKLTEKSNNPQLFN
ncbi:hypothetical protein PAEPH01_2309 [Pancytospora epiphaga]|nr:hypothetical protein PAEPH01_2309 [Pancytospora epiphaga]